MIKDIEGKVIDVIIQGVPWSKYFNWSEIIDLYKLKSKFGDLLCFVDLYFQYEEHGTEKKYLFDSIFWDVIEMLEYASYKKIGRLHGLSYEKEYLDINDGFGNFKYSFIIPNKNIAILSPQLCKAVYNDVKAKLRNLSRGNSHKVWADSVKNRDDYKCRECGSENNIAAHHIKQFAKHPELRFEIDNGITLCKMCHAKKHGKKI